jgi:hypothetical protein
MTKALVILYLLGASAKSIKHLQRKCPVSEEHTFEVEVDD